MNDYLKTILSLEYYGIRMEDYNNGLTEDRFYFSVPESSTLNCDDSTFCEQIKTSEGLMQLAKQELTRALIRQCKDDGVDDVKEIESYIEGNVKFFSKVRIGEVWTEEMAVARLDELLRASIKNAKGYQEV